MAIRANCEVAISARQAGLTTLKKVREDPPSAKQGIRTILKSVGRALFQ